MDSALLAAAAATTSYKAFRPASTASTTLSERQKNSARWRDWHHRNREKYNLKRRGAAKRRAQQVNKSPAAAAPKPTKEMTPTPSPPPPPPQPTFHYWTRQYDAAQARPRPTGWEDASEAILLLALTGGSSVYHHYRQQSSPLWHHM